MADRVLRRFKLSDCAISLIIVIGVPAAICSAWYVVPNIISLQQRVYGHTRTPTKIDKEHWASLFDHGLLGPDLKALGTSHRNRKERDSQFKSKLVPVHVVRLLKTSKKGNLFFNLWAMPSLSIVPRTGWLRLLDAPLPIPVAADLRRPDRSLEEAAMWPFGHTSPVPPPESPMVVLTPKGGQNNSCTALRC